MDISKMPFLNKELYCKFPRTSYIIPVKIFSKDFMSQTVQIFWSSPMGGRVYAWVPAEWILETNESI